MVALFKVAGNAEKLDSNGIVLIIDNSSENVQKMNEIQRNCSLFYPYGNLTKCLHLNDDPGSMSSCTCATFI